MLNELKSFNKGDKVKVIPDPKLGQCTVESVDILKEKHKSGI